MKQLVKNPVVLIIVSCLLAVSLFANAVFLHQDASRNIVTSVPDGDSLDLADGRRIRLLGLDAPEKGRCLSEEARAQLTELTMGKMVKLSDTVTDSYGRTLANVYIGNQLINEEMVVRGYTKFVHVKSSESEKLKQASENAVKEEKGIYSRLCHNPQPVNRCDIKGNIRSGEKVYHLPSCKNYSQTVIDTAFGDQYFCTEKEARDAGFRKASACL